MPEHPSDTMREFSHVTIVGCGLIGGSLALALRRSGFSGRITACGGTRGPQIAVARGIVDAIEESFTQGTTCPADLVYLAAPIGAIINFLRSEGSRIQAGTLVTDAGSTKVEICRAAESLAPGVHFVGGHPMAGSEHSGVEYARADLFDRATYALALDEKTNRPAFDSMTALVSLIGARPVTVDPAEHDRAVALISHLPQLVASELSSLLTSNENDASSPVQLGQKLAASGWSDMTRLGGSAWRVWRDIIVTNEPNISLALRRLISELQGLEEALAVRDFNYVRAVFDTANAAVEEQRSRRYQPFDKV